MTFEKFKRMLVGCPLETHREKHERLIIPLALAVFASDALSSTAYATEEILKAFIEEGMKDIGNLLSIPVSLAIVLLIIIVVTSYRQVIRAYPQGGGAYIVAKECLGPISSQIAGSALLIDYILTVAVSICAGIEALTSTGYVDKEYATPIALFCLIIIMFINLRGVRESGKFLAFPAYIFIGSLYLLIGCGLWQIFTGEHTVAAIATDGINAASSHPAMSSLVLFALLKAFSHGCTALTGIEAISNGVKAFKEPVSLNANRTMVIMGVILSTLFLGVTYLAFQLHTLPLYEHNLSATMPHHDETVISQIARAVFGDGSLLYWIIQIFTMIILILAANTSFAGFPRLANLLADDGFLPRQLMSLGDRLVFSNGIMILGITSAILIIAFNADTHRLIPLYAVGVFLSFTLAQAGMVKHHLRHQEARWKTGIMINGVGAVVTALVTLLLAFEKFVEGAFIAIIAILAFIVIFRLVNNHYLSIGKQLALPETGYCPIAVEHTVLVLVSSLNKGTIPALEYAKTISDRVEAVHIELRPESTDRLRKAWDEWGCGIPLTILKSPYRSISEPILKYVTEVEERYDHDIVTIIVPEFVTKKFWHNLLHNQTSILIKALLRMKRGKVVTTIRYYLDE